MIARHLPVVFLAVLWAVTGFGHNEPKLGNEVHFTENKGQWDDQILYRAGVLNGVLFLEQQALTWTFQDEYDIARIHDLYHGKLPNAKDSDYHVECHAFKTHFVGSNPDAAISRDHAYPNYDNYFIGNDRSKWASNVKHFEEVAYSELYNHIDLKIYSQGPDVKYDFIVRPGGDWQDIVLEYEGLDDLFVKDGRLHIRTSINEIVEQRPFAFQWVNGRKTEVPCAFDVQGNQVRFQLSGDFDPTADIVIDPQLVFSSYTGSQSDNWGFTATFDQDEFLYAGGIVFGNGYPKTTGAFIQDFQGGQTSANLQGNFRAFDVAISKFSQDGTSLVYSTYLGGSGNEAPHSLVVNNQNELIVFGTTSSDDFPTSPGAFDNTFNGGTNINRIGLLYKTGTDLYVVKLNSAGSALLGGTYIGGAENDGLNQGNLGNFSYGDIFRGEVIVNDADEIFVATCTQSDDFPTTPGSFQTGYGGGNQDGVVFKLNSNFSNLDWCSYIGGSEDDGVYAMQPNAAGELYICGGTESNDLPGTANGLNPNYSGDVDGFVAHIGGNGQQLLSATYLGTESYDQVFFVQLDPDDDVYVLGQSDTSGYPVTAGVYSNPNSGQFIHKLSPDLDQTRFSTVIGTGSGKVDITLTAFLVSNCGQIYLSGWGGGVNNNFGNSNSTTSGLPVTNDAFDSNTNGSDFYVMVLDSGAASLVFGSFLGGDQSNEHCDGGTSRFDKNGTVYQAVCAGCGGNSDFPTSQTAHSRNNNSQNCNLAAFKYDISDLTARIGFDVPDELCIPAAPVTFTNISTGGTTFTWDFGDGNTSTDFQPTHEYTEIGTYTITLIASDPNSFCAIADTSIQEIVVNMVPIVNIEPVEEICEGDTTQLDASATIGEPLIWSPTTHMDSAGQAGGRTPFVWPPDTTTYVLSVNNICGTGSDSVTLGVIEDRSGIMPDTAICKGGIVELEAFGGISYSWSPTTNILDGTGDTVLARVQNTTLFTVIIPDTFGCVWEQEVTVYVNNGPPVIDITPDTTICSGDSIQLSAVGGVWTTWYGPNLPDEGIEDDTIWVAPSKNGQFRAVLRNGCGTNSDFTNVYMNRFNLTPIPDTAVCPGIEFNLDAGYSESYDWSPIEFIKEDHKSQRPVFVMPPDTAVEFKVVGQDTLGCVDSTWLTVSLLPKPYFDLGDDVIIDFGDRVNLFAYADSGEVTWSQDITLSCFDCYSPEAYTLESNTYYAELLQSNGCYNNDSVRILVEGGFFAPNTFTPNGDHKNDIFFVYGKELHNFQLNIFNRWGERIYTSTDIYDGWNGNINGRPAQIDTYVWRAEYSNLKGQRFFHTGHVNLVR